MLILKFGMLAAFRKYLNAVFTNIPLTYQDIDIVKLQSITTDDRKFKVNLDKARIIKNKKNTNGIFYIDSFEEAEYLYPTLLVNILTTIQEIPVVVYPLQDIWSRINSVVYRNWNKNQVSGASRFPDNISIEYLIRNMFNNHLRNVGINNIPEVSDNYLMNTYIFHGKLEELINLHNNNKIKLLLLTPSGILTSDGLQQLFSELKLDCEVPILQPHQHGRKLPKEKSDLRDNVFEQTKLKFNDLIIKRELEIKELININNIKVI
jgi:hypothetical protein